VSVEPTDVSRRLSTGGEAGSLDHRLWSAGRQPRAGQEWKGGCYPPNFPVFLSAFDYFGIPKMSALLSFHSDFSFFLLARACLYYSVAFPFRRSLLRSSPPPFEYVSQFVQRPCARGPGRRVWQWCPCGASENQKRTGALPVGLRGGFCVVTRCGGRSRVRLGWGYPRGAAGRRRQGVGRHPQDRCVGGSLSHLSQEVLRHEVVDDQVRSAM
jgi:hypothetical protein